MRGRTNIGGGISINANLKKYEIAEGHINRGDFVDATSLSNTKKMMDGVVCNSPVQGIHYNNHIACLIKKSLYLYDLGSNTFIKNMMFDTNINANSNMIDNGDGSFYFVDCPSRRLLRISLEDFSILETINISSLGVYSALSTTCIGISRIDENKFIILASSTSNVRYCIFTITSGTVTQIKDGNVSNSNKYLGYRSYVTPIVKNGRLYVVAPMYSSMSRSNVFYAVTYEIADDVLTEKSSVILDSTGNEFTNGGYESLINDDIFLTTVGSRTTSDRLMVVNQGVVSRMQMIISNGTSYYDTSSCIGKTPYGFIIACAYCEDKKKKLSFFLYNVENNIVSYNKTIVMSEEDLGLPGTYLGEGNVIDGIYTGIIVNYEDKLHMIIQMSYYEDSTLKSALYAMEFVMPNRDSLTFNSLIKIKPTQGSIFGVANEDGDKGDKIDTYVASIY